MMHHVTTHADTRGYRYVEIVQGSGQNEEEEEEETKDVDEEE